MRLLTVQPSGLYFAARSLLWPDRPPQHTRPASLTTACLLLNTAQANGPHPPTLSRDTRGWSQTVSTSLITMSWIALKPMLESKDSFLNECHMYSILRSNAWRVWANPQPSQEGRQEGPQRGPRIARPGAHAAQEEAQEASRAPYPSVREQQCWKRSCMAS